MCTRTYKPGPLLGPGFHFRMSVVELKREALIGASVLVALLVIGCSPAGRDVTTTRVPSRDSKADGRERGMLGSEEPQPSERLGWIELAKANFNAGQVVAWARSIIAAYPVEQMIVESQHWPEWLRHPQGGLTPPAQVFRLQNPNDGRDYVMLDYGTNVHQFGIVVTDTNVFPWPHATTTVIRWEEGAYFFFAEAETGPRQFMKPEDDGRRGSSR